MRTLVGEVPQPQPDDGQFPQQVIDYMNAVDVEVDLEVAIRIGENGADTYTEDALSRVKAAIANIQIEE
jgi:hypothetical protein